MDEVDLHAAAQNLGQVALAVAEALPTEELPFFVDDLQAALALSVRRLARASQRESRVSFRAEGHSLVDAKYVAKRLGVSVQTVYRNAPHYSFAKKHGSRSWRFDPIGLEQAIRTGDVMRKAA